MCRNMHGKIKVIASMTGGYRSGRREKMGKLVLQKTEVRASLGFMVLALLVRQEMKSLVEP